MSFRFPYPFPVIAFLYGMFCTLSCPTFYAQSNAGPARAINVVYYGFILTSYIALFYLAGWVYNKTKTWEISFRPESGTGSPISVYCCLMLLVLVLQFCIGLHDDTIKQASSVQALRDIIHGTAAAYDREYADRILLLETSEEQDIVLLPYQHQPLTVYVGDYGGDPTQVSNQALAKWYGQHSVTIDYEN